MRRKSLKLSIVGIIILIVVLYISSLLNKEYTPTEPSINEGSDTKEVIFNTESDTQEPEIITNVEPDINEEVEVGIDFKFDTNKSSTIETGKTKDEILQTPKEELQVKRDSDDVKGYTFTDSEHLSCSTFGNVIQFYGLHSDAHFSVTEVNSFMSMSELRELAYSQTYYGYYLNEIHDIPYNTPYTKEDGIKNPEDFFVDNDSDGIYGEEANTDSFKILFESSTELTTGTVYYIGAYLTSIDSFSITGYYVSNDGRKFTFSGSDSKYKYLLAYVSDMFENCIIPV